MKKDNLEIKKDGKLIKYKVVKTVTKSGTGGSVTLPKELIGKEVYIEYVEGVGE